MSDNVKTDTEVAESMDVEKNFRVVGRNLPRQEAKRKIKGEAKYVDDIPTEDALYGRTVRSPEPRGKIKDVKFKNGIPWEEFVIVLPEDIPGENIVHLIHNEMPFLAEDEVKYRGEPVALIAHEDEMLVEKALDYVEIELETENMEPMFTIDEALRKDNVQYQGGLKTNEPNVFAAYEIEDGDINQGWQHADVIVEETYRSAAQEHLYIEPNGLISRADPQGQIFVEGSMQCPYYIQEAMIHLFDVDPEAVQILQDETGGAFGGKEDFPSMLAGHAALLSWHADGKPVRMIYDREEDMLASTKRHPSKTEIKAGFTEEGEIVALDIDFVLNGGAYPTLSSTVLSRGILHSFGPYKIDNANLQARAVMTNSTPYAAFRGFGTPQSIFAMETHMNKAASVLGLAPEEIRRRNFLEKGDFMPTGQEIKEEIDLEYLMDEALDKINYDEKQEKIEQFNAQSKTVKKGLSLSTFFHGAGFTGSGEEDLASRAAVRLTENAGVQILGSQVDFGQGIHTGFVQIAAEACNIPTEWVDVHQPDTKEVPDSGPTVASRSTMIVGRLIQKACDKLVERLQERAGLPEEFSADDFKEAARNYLGEFGELKTEVQYKEPEDIKWDEEEYRGEAYSGYAWSCDVAEVEVDLIDYRAEVTDFVSTVECGQVINPELAAAQIEGGAVQGIGYALYEYPIMEEDGAMKNNQFSNYIIPTAADVPDLDVEFIEFPHHNYGPYSAKGIGELPMDGPAPAVASAVARALDNHFIPEIPLLPEVIMEAIEMEVED
ncbi:MAG: xanthine dehydrogenase family protein molybdopterin-binding subunit [bacterium]